MALALDKKIDLLTAGAGFDVCSPLPAEPPASPHPGREWERWLYPAILPGGRVVRLFKVLLSNVCENDCLYCGNRSGSDCRRASFSPDELVRAFLMLNDAGLAGGLFLSSALGGNAAAVMERMLAAVELLRGRHGFRGYVHLKLLPGAERAAVARALQLADRVSLNLEAPNAHRLANLSARKNFADLAERLRWAAELRRERQGAPAGLTTQFVVGAAGESDAELLATAARLSRAYGLARVYFSAFRPLTGTPLAGLPPTPAWRERRLYQAEFLLRRYDFQPEDFVLTAEGNLPAALDPKLLWAQTHPEVFPVDLATADHSLLLRVPGIGPRGARRILAARRQGELREPDALRALGVSLRRVGPYALLAGRRLGEPQSVQMALAWEPPAPSGSAGRPPQK